MSKKPDRKRNKGLHLAFCEQCDRFFDVRSGCEADIRYDECQQIEERVAALLRDRYSHAEVEGKVLREVLAMLADKRSAGAPVQEVPRG